MLFSINKLHYVCGSMTIPIWIPVLLLKAYTKVLVLASRAKRYKRHQRDTKG